MQPEPRPDPHKAPAPGADLPGWIQAWVDLSENAFTIPGTRFKVGWDAILGLFAPGVGDWASALGSLAMIWVAARHNVPQRVLLRMLFNVMLDATVGAIPLLGDTFDLFFRSNTKNLKLLRAHAQTQLSGRHGAERLLLAMALVVAAAAILLWVLFLTLALLLLWGGFAWFGG
jgi:hypothetical protein